MILVDIDYYFRSLNDLKLTFVYCYFSYLRVGLEYFECGIIWWLRVLTTALVDNKTSGGTTKVAIVPLVLFEVLF